MASIKNVSHLDSRAIGAALQAEKKDCRWKDWQEHRRHGSLPSNSYKQRLSPQPGICGDDQDCVLADIIYNRPVSRAEEERCSRDKVQARMHVDPRCDATRTTFVRAFQQRSSPRSLGTSASPKSWHRASRISPRDDPGRTMDSRPYVWYEEVQVPQRHEEFECRPAGRPSPREGSARATANTLADQLLKMQVKKGLAADLASTSASTTTTWWGGWSSRSSGAMSEKRVSSVRDVAVTSPLPRTKRTASVEEKTHQSPSPENVLANPTYIWGEREPGAIAGGGTAIALPPPSVLSHRGGSVASVASSGSRSSVRAPSAASPGPTPGSARLSTRVLQDHETTLSPKASIVACGSAPSGGGAVGTAPSVDDGIVVAGNTSFRTRGASDGAERPGQASARKTLVRSTRETASEPASSPRGGYVPAALQRSGSACSDREIGAGNRCFDVSAPLMSGGPPPRAVHNGRAPSIQRASSVQDYGAAGHPSVVALPTPRVVHSRCGISGTSLMRGSSPPVVGGTWTGASEQSPLHPRGRRHLRSGECAPTHGTFEALFPERVLLLRRPHSAGRT